MRLLVVGLAKPNHIERSAVIGVVRFDLGVIAPFRVRASWPRQQISVAQCVVDSDSCPPSKRRNGRVDQRSLMPRRPSLAALCRLARLCLGNFLSAVWCRLIRLACCNTIWPHATRSVIGQYSFTSRPVSAVALILFCTALALVHVAVSHPLVSVELSQRLGDATLEACFFGGLHAPPS